MKNCQRHVLLLRSSVTKKKKKDKSLFLTPGQVKQTEVQNIFIPLPMRLPLATTHFLRLPLASCRGKHLFACPASILHFHSVSMDFLTTQLCWPLSATFKRYTSLVVRFSDQTDCVCCVQCLVTVLCFGGHVCSQRSRVAPSQLAQQWQ